MQNEQLKRSAQPLGGIVACSVMPGCDPCEQPRQYGEFARQNVGNHATFGFDEDSIKTAFIAAHVVPGSRQRGEPAIVEKEPRDDVEPFIARCACDSCKARQALSIGQNLFGYDVERWVLCGPGDVDEPL